MKREKKLISMNIDEDLIEKVDDIAFQTRRNRTAIVQEAILLLIEEWNEMEARRNGNII